MPREKTIHLNVDLDIEATLIPNPGQGMEERIENITEIIERDVEKYLKGYCFVNSITFGKWGRI